MPLVPDPSGASGYISAPYLSNAPDAFCIGRLVTRSGKGIDDKVKYGGDQGIIIFGPNGKGKGTSLLIPHLLQSSGSSLVVVDPKGELAAVTAKYRQELGRVVVINPFGLHTELSDYQDLKSAGFNPLAKLDPASDSFNSEAAQLAEALVSVGGSREPHWPMSGRALVAAIIMQATINARNLGKVPTIADVRELLCQMSDAPHEGNNKEGLGIPKLAREMMRQQKHTGLKNKAAQFVDWNREIQSIASTARIQTEPFDDNEIARDLRKEGLDFADLKREPITVYLVLPPLMMERHSKWLRLIITAALQNVLRPRRQGEPRVTFLMDEFFALGHMEIVSTVWALVRGYGVQMVPVLQDLGQLKKLYPDMWETFIGNAGAITSFATNDLTTAEWFSRRAGETTRDITSESQSINFGSSLGSNTGGQGGGTTSFSESSGTSFSSSSAPQKTTLITPHTLFGLPPYYMVGVVDGMSDVLPLYAPPYLDIKECVARKRDNPFYPG